MDNNDPCCLPDDFVGRSKPSKVIERLYEKRKNAEIECIETLSKTKKEIIEKYVSIANSKVEQLKKSTGETRECIKHEIFEAKLRANNDNAHNMQKESFDDIYSRIEYYTQKKHDLIEAFFKDLNELELEKSQEFKGILKGTYEKLKSISYKSHHEYDEFIEFEIEKVNQEILCNHRTYIDIKTQLELETENDLKYFIDELKLIKACWTSFIKNQTEEAVSKLKHQTLKDILSSSRNNLDDQESIVGEAEKIRSSFNLDLITKEETLEEWLKKLRLNLAVIDQKAQNVITNFKKATIIFFNRFFEELKTVEEALGDIIDREEITSIQCEVYTPSLEEIKEKYEIDIKILQKTWNDLVAEMTKSIDETYKLLLLAATLFSKHFSRLKALQLMIYKDVNNTILSNNTNMQACNAKLNVLIDTLRQESTKEKLNKTFGELNKYLGSIEDLIRAQYQSELTTTKKYKIHLDLALDVLLAEMNRFLVVCPPDLEKDPKIQRKRASQTSEIANHDEDLIPNQIWYCKFQVDAVTNWGFGLWETIKNYAPLAKEDLQQGDRWVNSQIDRLNTRLEIRLNVVKMRFMKSKYYVYDERLDELNLHKFRFEEHRQAIERQIFHLKESNSEYEEQCNEIFQTYNQEIQKLESRCLKVQSSSMINAYFRVLKSKEEECSKDIEETFSKYITACTDFLEKVKASNILFINSMKLFSEDGNYSVQEVKDYIKHLSKLEGQVEKAVTSAEKDTEVQKLKIVDSVKVRHDEVSHTLKIVKEEYIHKEYVEKKIRDLERDVFSKVISCQNDIKVVQTSFKELDSTAKNFCGEYEYYNDYCEVYDGILAKVETLGKYFIHPTPIILYSDKTSADHSDSKFNSLSNDGKVSAYTEKLFNFPADSQDSNYISDLNQLLEVYWKNITDYSKKFFSEHTHFFIEHPEINQTFDSFLEKLYKKCLLYQNQFETRWIKDATDFDEFLEQVISFYENYNIIYLIEYQTKSLKELDNWYMENVKKSLKDKKEEVENLYANLHNKLMPLHGHPNNKKLMDKLNEEAELVHQKSLEIIKDSKTPYLEAIDEFFNKKIIQFQLLKNSINENGDRISTVKEIKIDLRLSIPNKLDLLRSFVSFLEMNNEKDEGLLPQCQSFLNLFDNDISKRDSREKIQFAEMKSLSADTYDYDEYILLNCANTYDFVWEVSTLLNKRLQEVEKQDNDALISTFEDEWKCAVDKVLSLYQVRYDKRK
ncbi:uncharacterized protein LOC115877010 [Sitophilus oryzae]|uniref:Uncharacterized protein LOC115877010 n=1 Tax=Sitophilus oryzae TaxID=7048 RepID=A0A6J2XCG6_SITOR|nr:uncharacterized protein LOC115877010 [Sitophilus oryzae]